MDALHPEATSKLGPYFSDFSELGRARARSWLSSRRPWPVPTPAALYPRPPERRTFDLRRGRISVPGAFYFITFCTRRRTPVLNTPATHEAGGEVCRRLSADGDVTSFTSTIMPDHVHLLFRLGARLSLSRVVAKWRAGLTRAVPDVSWQSNFFDHRLHPGEDPEHYAWYAFMNPYCAGLVSLDESWAGWWLDGETNWEFLSHARPGPSPLPEWLDVFEGIARRLNTSESDKGLPGD